MDDHAPSQPSVAETLPETYRHVLDRIADLETAGHRREADLVRADAIAAYARSWNDRTARRLGQLATRADRVLDGHDRPRTRTGTRRSEIGRWLSSVAVRAERRVIPATSDPSGRGGTGITAERPTA